jgi:hypothetical protein
MTPMFSETGEIDLLAATNHREPACSSSHVTRHLSFRTNSNSKCAFVPSGFSVSHFSIR